MDLYHGSRFGGLSAIRSAAETGARRDWLDQYPGHEQFAFATTDYQLALMYALEKYGDAYVYHVKPLGDLEPDLTEASSFRCREGFSVVGCKQVAEDGKF